MYGYSESGTRPPSTLIPAHSTVHGSPPLQPNVSLSPKLGGTTLFMQLTISCRLALTALTLFQIAYPLSTAAAAACA